MWRPKSHFIGCLLLNIIFNLCSVFILCQTYSKSSSSSITAKDIISKFSAVVQIFVTFILIKICLDAYGYLKNESAQDKAKRDFFMGYANVVFCLIAPFGYMSMSELNPMEEESVFYIHSLSSTFIIFIFIVPHIRTYTLAYDHHGTILFAALSVSIWTIIFRVYPAIRQSEGKLAPFEMHILFCCLNYAFLVNLLVYFKGGVRAIRPSVTDTDDDNDDLELFDDYEIPEEITISSRELECNICTKQYSDKIKSRTPRVLTGCGHTLCKQCCKTIWEQKGRYTLFCPFCTEGTLINGSVNELPKNYAILSMIHEIVLEK